MTGPVLEAEGLTVHISTPAGELPLVRDVSLRVEPGDFVGIVGESGSGKTLTTRALSGLLPPGARMEASALRFAGEDLLTLPRRRRDSLLGTRLAMVFQDPSSSLNPARRIGSQMVEAVVAHERLPRRKARELAATRLEQVRIDRPAQRLRQRPHELSGGQRQRVMIAMGLMGNPALIIADEPTTALDVTVQDEVMTLLRTLNREQGVAVLMVSHNIALLSQVCNRIVVMYAGRVVESGPAAAVVGRPGHPYAEALMAVVPDLGMEAGRELPTIAGAPPDALAPPPGCAFAPRCPLAVERCAERPPLVALGAGHAAACWRAEERSC
ncbi:ABC transporter ATP-binding protein [Conexibacter stalactiti]|uniref:ABC transporter ATP-binding protein n=1 Tax=Conexibacter stalactiti TaxID=1940611 RepID=A0ABU4I2A9_9ACTN|nr:ABC transporter ATP-binding protein [Conexibacter stalactiti]MDW5598429.1 ABC transporter ATP-binding protein [Conexibacter stalactiti]MEC5039071.1 ABC transporter ATP-binding protein [Conexibacter stalactiti]